METLTPCPFEQRKESECTFCTGFQKEGHLIVTAIYWVVGPELESCLPQGFYTCCPFNLVNTFSAISHDDFCLSFRGKIMHLFLQAPFLPLPSTHSGSSWLPVLFGIARTELAAISDLISIFPLNCEFPRSKDLIYPFQYYVLIV